MATVKKAKKYQGGGDVPSWASKFNTQQESERKNPALADERRRKADSTAMADWKKAAAFERAYHKKEGNKIEDRKSGSTAYTVVPKKKEMKSGGPVKKAKSGTEFGMLSVKAGVDKNPKATFADKIAGAKKMAKSGTKMKMGGAMKKAAKAVVAKKIIKSIKKK